MKKRLKAAKENIVEKVSDAGKSNYESYADDRFWAFKKDSSGNFSGLIRFLPNKQIEDSSVIVLKQHLFQLPDNTYFNELCPKMIGEPCPICEHVAPYWKGSESDKKYAGKLGVSTTYVSNILLIKDTTVPENNGSVKMWKFGKKVYEKIIQAIQGDEDIAPIDVYDFDDGHNFKLTITQVSGFNNYDKSTFLSAPSAICGGNEAEQEEVFESLFDLNVILQEHHQKIKEYDKLRETFEKALNFINSGKSEKGNASQKMEDKAKKEELAREKSKPKKTEILDEDDELENLDEIFGDSDPDDDIPF